MANSVKLSVALEGKLVWSDIFSKLLFGINLFEVFNLKGFCGQLVDMAGQEIN